MYKITTMEVNLTEEEKLFCELYANGDAPFAGNPVRCYEEAFGKAGGTVRSKALQFLCRKDVQEYLNDLEKLTFEETRYMKKFLTRNLTKIVEECATREFLNKKGNPISPAPLRSVSVQAAKALMEMYPVREAQRINLESENGTGITFNVIVPEKQKENKN